MGFNSVLHSLQELFPQVDVRLLKAVAIEHSKDVHGAVESILFEVLPTISSPQEALLTAEGKHGAEREESFLWRHQEAVEETNLDVPSETRSVASEVASGTDHTNDTLSVTSTCSDEALAGSFVSSAHGVTDFGELFVDNDKEEVISSAEHQEVNLLDKSNYGSFSVPSIMTHEVALVSDHCTDALPFDIQGLNGDIAYDSLASICREDHQDHPCLDTNSPKGDKSLTIQQHELPVHEENLDSVECGATSYKGVNIYVSECKEPGSTSSLESSVEHLIFDTHMGDSVDKSKPTTITIRSGQIISIDFLEEFISVANDNKKTLLLAMESVLSKVREVELLEKAAEQAKEEARGGLDIHSEVEKLKQMVHQEKEAYDMHAWEVYGEKATLATEARELQSRLLNLSNERDKSLSIIDEMNQNLEERLAAAEAEKVAAEKERLEKEESTRKTLDEQLLIMDKVVQESKKLQQEAEENAKLREFLMNRGRIVDILQGEIGVICDNVKLLKERIDGCLPINNSLSSSQISNSSSMSSRSVSLHRIIKQVESSESLEMPSQEKLSNSDQCMDMGSSNSQKTSSDDEWIFLFKDEAELCS